MLRIPNAPLLPTLPFLNYFEVFQAPQERVALQHPLRPDGSGVATSESADASGDSEILEIHGFPWISLIFIIFRGYETSQDLLGTSWRALRANERLECVKS